MRTWHTAAESRQNDWDWHHTRQLGAAQMAASVALPSALAYGGFHGLLPWLVAQGVPPLPAWMLVASAMLGLLVGVAVHLLQREARVLCMAFTTRACLRPLTRWQWGVYLGVMVVGLVVATFTQACNLAFMERFSLRVPDYMPFFLNPQLNPAAAGEQLLSPGFPLRGANLLLPAMAVVLVLNILAEELYFRAWLLPKMAWLGPWSWVINGSVFALYHSFQIWLLPVLLVASLFFAFVVYHSKSIWPAMLAHLAGNLVFSLFGLAVLIAG